MRFLKTAGKKSFGFISSVRSHPINIDWLVLIILLGVMNIPMLLDKNHIIWDSFGIYQFFSIVYSAVRFHSHIPLWLPYSAYGMPEFFSLIGLSIVNYLFIGIGKLFSIQNTLVLYRFSLVGEQLIALGGMYLLARQLFKKRVVVLLVCLSTLATFAIYRQAQFNFRMVYLLPLILLCIVLFFKRRQAEYLWAAGIVMLFSIPGSAYYPLIIEFYAIALFSFILLLYDIKIILTLFKPSWRNILLLSCLVLLAGLFIYYFMISYQGVEIIRKGRNPNLSVTLDNFFASCCQWSPLDLLVSYATGILTINITNLYEYVFYLGLLPLLAVVAACLFQRKPIWTAVLGAGIFLFLFSLKGFSSLEVYFLPLVNRTRYVAILGTIPFRTFLILAAGFGLDLDLTQEQLKKLGLALVGLVVIAEILVQLSLPANIKEILTDPFTYSRDFKYFYFRMVGCLVLVLLVFATRWLKKQERLSKLNFPLLLNLAIVLFVLVDLALFRYNYEKKVQVFQEGQPVATPALSSVSPLPYQDARLKAPTDAHTQQLIQYSTVFQNVNPYGMESYVQFDRCLPTSASTSKAFEVMASSLAPLVKGGFVIGLDLKASLPVNQVYACGYPKLRVVANLLVAPNDQAALDALNTATDLSNELVLSGVGSSLKTDLNHPAPQASVQVLNFAENTIKIEVDADQAGWLVYSDAYSPEWRATVNGKSTPIEHAYLAFKAVPLSKGKNIVEFDYGSPLHQFAYTLMAFLCGLAGLIALVALIALTFIDLDAWSGVPSSWSDSVWRVL